MSPKYLGFIITALALLLYTADLGDVGLWADEGETLVLAQHTLHHGAPTASDGDYHFCASCAVTRHGLWTAQPWVQFYLAAFGILVFGKSIAGLRLIFVLFGVACVPLLWRLVQRFGFSKRVQVTASVLLCLNIPFILLVRNVRYYALLPFLTLCLLLLYLDLREGRRRTILFGIVSALFMHTHEPVGAAVIAAIGVHALIFDRRKTLLWELLKSELLMLILFVPWLAYVWEALVRYYDYRSTSTLGRNMTAADAVSGTLLYLQHLVIYNFPALLLIPAGVFALKNPLGAAVTKQRRDACALLGVCVVFICVVMAVMFNSNLWSGYLVACLPLVVALAAVIIDRACGKTKWPAVLVVVIVVFSNALNLPYWPFTARDPAHGRFDLLRKQMVLPQISFLLPQFLEELVTPYDGPVEGIIAYLNQHAKSEDTFFATNDLHTLHFMTGLNKVDTLPFSQPPSWIIRRGRTPWAKSLCSAGGLDSEEYVNRYLKEHRYEIIVLDYPNIYHENEPIVPFHHFVTPPSEHKVTLFRYAGAL